jgi:hypothetical protein
MASEPAPVLDNREQAIAWLGLRGLSARAHSGWLGDGIAVSRAIHRTPQGATHEHSIILHPEAGGWVLARSLPGRRGASERFDTLGMAAQKVVAYLTAPHG